MVLWSNPACIRSGARAFQSRHRWVQLIFFQERTKRERGRDVKWKLDLNHRFSGGVPSNINLKHFLVLNLTVIEALEGLKKRNQ